jgi:hypothetical protein
MPFRLLSARNGYETIPHKAQAASFGQMQPVMEKTIANFRKSAHGMMMSKQHHGIACSYGGRV